MPDPARLASCGTCGQSEEAHKWKVGQGDLDLFAALGGACTHFTASDATVIYQKHLALASRAPRRQPGGPIPRRGPLCGRCGYRGHRQEICPL